nr:MAG TPA: hypothetical protein [Caudoviricetes sp.]
MTEYVVNTQDEWSALISGGDGDPKGSGPRGGKYHD